MLQKLEKKDKKNGMKKLDLKGHFCVERMVWLESPGQGHTSVHGCIKP